MPLVQWRRRFRTQVRAVWGPALCFAARFVCAKNLLALLNEYG